MTDGGNGRGCWVLPLVLLLGLLIGALGLAAAQSLIQERLGSAEVPTGTPDPNPDLTLTLSPGLLTVLVRQSVERGEAPLPIQNVQVQTQPGRVFLLGRFDLLGRQVDGSIEMTPVLEHGQVRMKVIQARLESVPVPGNIERLVEAPINQRIEAATAGYPATLTGVRADHDGVTVTARVRPEDLRRPSTPTPGR
jgi:hypothetical protein